MSYVTTAYDAVVIAGEPRPDGDETSAAAWWAAGAIETLPMNEFTRSLLRSLDVILAPSPPPPGPG